MTTRRSTRIIVRVIRSDGRLALIPCILVVSGVVALAASVIAIADYVGLMFQVSFSVVGALLAIRRPRNPIGWLLLANAAAFVGTSQPGPNIDVLALQERRAPLDLALRTWIGAWAGGASWLLYAALAMIFPSGALPSGREGRVARGTLLLGLLILGLSMLTPRVTVFPNDEAVDVPNPFGVLPESEAIGFVEAAGLGVLLGSILVGIAMLLRRYRRAEGVARLQIRWVLAAIGITLGAIVLGIVLTILVGEALGGLVWVPAVLAYPMLPIAVGVAIFRYRLFEIDRIVNRTIVYGSLTAILAGLVAAATATSQRLLTEVTGGSEFATIVIALVVVTLYTPLRKRIEAFVDRYFKYEQRQFGSYREELTKIAALVDPEAAAERLAREAIAETRATGVAVLGQDGRLLAAAGDSPVDVAARISIEAGTQLGAIVIGPRRDGRPHSEPVIEALARVAVAADVVARAGVLGRHPEARIQLQPAVEWSNEAAAGEAVPERPRAPAATSGIEAT